MTQGGRRAWFVLAVMLVGAGIVAVLLVGRLPVSSPPAAVTATSPSRAAVHAPRLAIPLAGKPAPPPALQVAGDGIPIMGPGDSDSTANGRRHPHPLTPEHQRLFRENAMVGRLAGAMNVGDFAAMRKLNQEYRRDYPEDGHQLQSGYDLIADCLEKRTLRTEATAREYDNSQRGSTLRRYVRRHCLE